MALRVRTFACAMALVLGSGCGDPMEEGQLPPPPPDAEANGLCEPPAGVSARDGEGDADAWFNRILEAEDAQLDASVRAFADGRAPVYAGVVSVSRAEESMDDVPHYGTVTHDAQTATPVLALSAGRVGEVFALQRGTTGIDAGLALDGEFQSEEACTGKLEGLDGAADPSFDVACGDPEAFAGTRLQARGEIHRLALEDLRFEHLQAVDLALGESFRDRDRVEDVQGRIDLASSFDFAEMEDGESVCMVRARVHALWSLDPDCLDAAEVTELTVDGLERCCCPDDGSACNTSVLEANCVSL